MKASYLSSATVQCVSAWTVAVLGNYDSKEISPKWLPGFRFATILDLVESESFTRTRQSPRAMK